MFWRGRVVGLLACIWAIGANASVGAVPAPKSQIDALASTVVAGIQRMSVKRCYDDPATPCVPRTAGCTLKHDVWVDIHMDPAGRRITEVQISVRAGDGHGALAIPNRAAKPVAVRAFAYFFPGWPEAASWLAHTYEAAVVSKAPMDVPGGSDRVPDQYGTVFRKSVGTLNVWAYKEYTQTGPEQTYVRIDITRGDKPVQPGPFGDDGNGNEN